MSALIVEILLFVLGLLCLVKGGDWFVDGATGIAHRFNMPEILIGATVVSIGTTIPEVMVSCNAALSGAGDMAYGNAIGSIICNTSLIAAITMTFRPSTLDRDSIKKPLVFFFGSALLYVIVAYTFGYFSRVTGVILLAVFLAYMIVCVRDARAAAGKSVDPFGRATSSDVARKNPKDSFTAASAQDDSVSPVIPSNVEGSMDQSNSVINPVETPVDPDESRMTAEYEANVLHHSYSESSEALRKSQTDIAVGQISDAADSAFNNQTTTETGSDEGTRTADNSKPASNKELIKFIGLLIIGAAVIAIGADLLVDNGTLIAVAIGVPQSVIALTFVALGTSLPELVTAITSLVKGHSDLSLGNVIGANLFNLVLVCGAAMTLSPFAVPVDKTVMGYNASFIVDIPIMLAVMLIMCIPPLVKGRIYRSQGIVLLCIYAGYVVFQFV